MSLSNRLTKMGHLLILLSIPISFWGRPSPSAVLFNASRSLSCLLSLSRKDVLALARSAAHWSLEYAYTTGASRHRVGAVHAAESGHRTCRSVWTGAECDGNTDDDGVREVDTPPQWMKIASRSTAAPAVGALLHLPLRSGMRRIWALPCRAFSF